MQFLKEREKRVDVVGVVCLDLNSRGPCLHCLEEGDCYGSWVIWLKMRGRSWIAVGESLMERNFRGFGEGDKVGVVFGHNRIS